MSEVTIKTNGRRRPVLEWHELTPTERAEFTYLMDDDARALAAQFFRFKGNVYDLGDMMGCPSNSQLKGWHYYLAETAWSGIVVRWGEDWRGGGWSTDTVVVGSYST